MSFYDFRLPKFRHIDLTSYSVHRGLIFFICPNEFQKFRHTHYMYKIKLL